MATRPPNSDPSPAIVRLAVSIARSRAQLELAEETATSSWQAHADSRAAVERSNEFLRRIRVAQEGPPVCSGLDRAD